MLLSSIQIEEFGMSNPQPAELRAHLLPDLKNISGLAFAPAGDSLLVSHHSQIYRLDVSTGHLLGHWTLPDSAGMIEHVGWTPDGSRILCVTKFCTIYGWDVDSKQPNLCVQAKVPADPKLTAEDPSSHFCQQAVFSPDGKQIALCSLDDQIHVWDLAQQRQVVVLKGLRSLIESVAFSRQGTHVLAGTSSLSVWELATGKKVLKAKAHKEGVKFLHLDGDRLLWGDDACNLHAVSLRDGSSQGSWKVSPHSGAFKMQLSGNGQRLLVPDRTLYKVIDGKPCKSIYAFDLAAERVSHSLDGLPGYMEKTALSWDGGLAATVNGQGLLLWDLA